MNWQSKCGKIATQLMTFEFVERKAVATFIFMTDRRLCRIVCVECICEIMVITWNRLKLQLIWAFLRC